MSELSEFFAVTVNGGLYHAKNERNEQGFPYLKKIGCRDANELNEKNQLGTKMENGRYLGISGLRLTLYNSHKTDSEGRPQGPDSVNMIHWGGGTSPISALFLKRYDAKKCLESKNHRQWDIRWEKETSETLKAIGSNHPLFIIGTTVAEIRRFANKDQAKPERLTKLSARQLLAITYAKMKKKLKAKKIVLPHDAYALIADDSDWHRTRQGFTRYKTAALFKIEKKKWIIAFGVACGSYPADPYNCDIACTSLGNKTTNSHEILDKSFSALEENACFRHSLIYAMADGSLAIDKNSSYCHEAIKLLQGSYEKYIARSPKYRNDIIHLDLRPVTTSSARYKPEFAEYLAEKLYEIIKSKSKKEVAV